MIAVARLPLFGFAVLAFLLLCVVLGFAVWFATRGAADAGKSRVSGPAGCAIGCALLAIAGLGALATVAVVVVNLPAEWARHGPISRLELRYDDSRPAEAEEHPDAPGAPEAPARPAAPGVHATIELRPGSDAGPVLRALRREVSSGLDISVRTIQREGVERTLIEIQAPLDEEAREELAELLRELKAEVPDLDVPAGVVLEIRGPND